LNEEAQSSNEEPEASKEEMQSLNEEQNTINAELNTTIEDLDRANSDLRNLFDATQIATVFLDSELVIRTFTPKPLVKIFGQIQSRLCGNYRALLKTPKRARFMAPLVDLEVG